MKRTLALLLLVAGACTAADVAQTTTSLPAATTATPPPGSATTEPSPVTTTTTTTTTTTLPPDIEIAWSETDAERIVTNYLAALAAGAYEQAMWSASNNGIEIDGASGSETPAETAARLCADGRCRGPYEVDALSPGLTDANGVASSVVAVTHSVTGDAADIRIATFEGQRIVADLPPLVPTDQEPATPVARLFGSDIPERVVVARFNAFEVWENGERTWITHWFADETVQVAHDVIATWNDAVSLYDPSQSFTWQCPRLMTRGTDTLVHDPCIAPDRLFDVKSGDPVEPQVELDGGHEGSVFYTERASTHLYGRGDAEGNLVELWNPEGRLILGDDYAGVTALSRDGRHVGYVDHRDPNAHSHFWSPVLVVRDVESGDEVIRTVLSSSILSIEFGTDWVVVAEANPEVLQGLEGHQAALVAINLQTGEVNRIETPVRLFLPS